MDKKYLISVQKADARIEELRAVGDWEAMGKAVKTWAGASARLNKARRQFRNYNENIILLANELGYWEKNL